MVDQLWPVLTLLMVIDQTWGVVSAMFTLTVLPAVTARLTGTLGAGMISHQAV